MEDQQYEHWRAFGAWLETKMAGRYNGSELARASGVGLHTVSDLLRGGRRQPDGSWRVSNPTDATLRKLASTLGVAWEEVVAQAGGTHRQRNPDRYADRLATRRDAKAAQAGADRLGELERQVAELTGQVAELVAERRGDADGPRRRRRAP